MAAVKFTGTADFNDVTREYEKVIKKVQKLEQENVKLKRQTDGMAKSAKNFGRAQESAVSGGVAKVAKLAAGYLSINSAIQLINKGLREKLELEGKSLDANVAISKSQADVVLALGDLSAKAKAEFIGRAAKLAAPVGEGGFAISQGVVQAAVADVISSVGGASQRELALRAVSAAAPIGAAKPEALLPLAKGGAALVQGLGGEVTASQAIGLFKSVIDVAPTADIADVARNFPTVAASIGAGLPGGLTRQAVREAGALTTTISTEARVSQEVGRTGSLQLAGQLAAFFQGGGKEFRELTTKRELAEIRKTRIEEGGITAAERIPFRQVGLQIKAINQSLQGVREIADPGTLFGRIEAINKSPELQTRIERTLTGEQSTIAVFRQILRGTGSPAARLKDNLEAITFSTKSIDQAGEELKGLTPQLKLGFQTRERLAGAEGFAVSARGVSVATIADVRKTVRQEISETATGGGLLGFDVVGTVSRAAARQTFEMQIGRGVSPQRAGVAALQSLQQSLLERGGGMAGVLTPVGAGAVSPGELQGQLAASFMGLQESVDSMKDEIKGLRAQQSRESSTANQLLNETAGGGRRIAAQRDAAASLIP